ncbi:MAG: DUF5018 domain-containing protein [Sphingobacterium hotanense]
MKRYRILFYTSVLFFLLLQACKEQVVTFSDANAKFQAIQIQKFDYENSRGLGPIYKGEYNAKGDTVYFRVTYYPDEQAPTATDWQIQGSLAQGVLVRPALAGVRDLTEPLNVELTASDGISKSNVVLKLLIYQIEYGELDYGFGRYSKLFEKNAATLGLTADNQRNLAVVDDYIVVGNGTSDLLVYDKMTGEKNSLKIPKPAGLNVWSVFADDDGVLHASNGVNFSATSTGTLTIYRWNNGINSAPELFYQMNTSGLAVSGASYISNAAIKGSSGKEAQIMFDIDGRGRAENKALRLTVSGGKVQNAPDLFTKPVTSVWNGKVVPMSSTNRTPFVAAMLGFPPNMGVQSNSGVSMFNVNAGNSNFLNMLIGGLHYFEFNNAKYLAVSTVNWGADYRLLIFNMDDLSLVESTKDNAVEYASFNVFSEDLLMKNVASAGDVTVQVQPDGKTALVYVLGAQSGIAAYQLTIIGGR